MDPVGVMSQRTPALQTTYSTSSEAFLLNKDDILNVHSLPKQRRYFNPSFCKIIEADILCNKYFSNLTNDLAHPGISLLLLEAKVHMLCKAF